MIESICQNCGNKKMFSDDKSGKKYKCPNCNEVVIIETIGTTITNEHQAKVTNTYADSIEKAEKENEEVERQQQYQKLLSKSKNWNGWGTFFYIITAIAILMIFSGDFTQVVSLLLWGGLGLYSKKKSKEFKETADNFFNEKIANNSVSKSKETDYNINDEPTLQTNITSVSISDKQGILTVRFAGQWFLIDAKTKIFVNGNLHSIHSTKGGFNAEIPIEKENMTIKVVLAGLKSTSFDLTNLQMTNNYLLELKYNDTWGKYSDEPIFSEIP